jgi:hypothetical protein
MQLSGEQGQSQIMGDLDIKVGACVYVCVCVVCELCVLCVCVCVCVCVCLCRLDHACLLSACD